MKRGRPRKNKAEEPVTEAKKRRMKKVSEMDDEVEVPERKKAPKKRGKEEEESKVPGKEKKKEKKFEIPALEVDEVSRVCDLFIDF